MTKIELATKMAGDAGISKNQAETALKFFTSSLTLTLKKGKKVTLVGFGTFSISKRKARKVRNPRTGKVIKIAAAKIPKFSAGKTFKDAVKK